MKPLYNNFLLRMLTILYKLSGYLYKDIVSKYIDDMRPLYNNFFSAHVFLSYTSKPHNLHAGCKVLIKNYVLLLLK